MTPQISIILPTFNERENILPLISAIEEALGNYTYEILVVDDQSPDGTAEVVEAIKNSRVRVIVRSQDKGYAKSILCGIENSKAQTIIMMDSDFNHSPSDLPRMLELLVDNDLVSASRFLKGGAMSPPWRAFASWMFNVFIRRITGSQLTDHLFGFFVIKRAVLSNIPTGDIFYGFGDYGIRLLYYLNKAHAKILEVPSVCGRRRTGTGNRQLFRTFVQYTKETLSLARKTSFHRN